MLDEIGDVNILIRRLTPTQETLNRINERVDAVFGALKQLENGVQLDEQKLVQLEEQIALLKQGLETVNRMAEELVFSFKCTEHNLKASAERLEVSLSLFRGLVKELGEKSDDIRTCLGTHDHEESGRWEKNGKGLGELQKRLADLKVMEIVILVLVVMVMSFLLFRKG